MPPAGWPRRAASRGGPTPNCCWRTCSTCRAAGCSPWTRCRTPPPRASVHSSSSAQTGCRCSTSPAVPRSGISSWRSVRVSSCPVPRPSSSPDGRWIGWRASGSPSSSPSAPGRAPSPCRSRTSIPARGSPRSNATPARSRGRGTTRPPGPPRGTLPWPSWRATRPIRGCCVPSTARSTWWSPTRPTCPTGRGYPARWLPTTRRWRCGAARTGSTSSAGCWSPPPGCCAPVACSASSTPTSREARCRPSSGGMAVSPRWPTTPTWPAARGTPPHGDDPPTARRPRPAEGGHRTRWGCGPARSTSRRRVTDLRPVADVYDCSDPEGRTAGLAAAEAAVARGELVLLPTDTVYGIGADAFTPAAVTGLLAAKNRGRTMPVPVLIGEASTLIGLVMDLPPVANEMAKEFWPGGLTLVVEHSPSLAWDLGDAEGTVAVRVPDDDLARDMLRRTGPLAVSSANRSGRPAATTAAQALEQLGDHVAVVLDGGRRVSPAASTIVDCAGRVPRVLRVGAISVEQLRELFPEITD